jgi:hypothetical protein
MKFNLRNFRMLLSVFMAFVLLSGVYGQDADWTVVSDTLFKSAEGFDDSVPGADGVGGVAVDRHSGDLIAGLNAPPFGIYRSKDAGATWQRIDGGNVDGAWLRPGSIQIDQDKPGRMAFFRGSPPAADGNSKKLSAMTLDGGETWVNMAKGNSFQGFGGWHHGYVDWSLDEPKNVIAQNRIRPQLQFSTDRGKTFKKIGKNKIAGIVEHNLNFDYIRATNPAEYEKRWLSRWIEGYGLWGGAVLIGEENGIERAEKGDGEFTKVSDLVASAYMPVRFQDKLYWGGEKGVLVSEDGGKTWAVLGKEIPMVRQGPFIGADASQVVVVTDDGVFKTTDGAANWEKVSDLKIDPTAWRPELGAPWMRHAYAWDHTRDILYVAGLSGSIYKKELSK